MTKKELEKMVRKYSRMRKQYNSSKNIARLSATDTDIKYFKELAESEFLELMTIEIFIEETLGVDLFHEYLERDF